MNLRRYRRNNVIIPLLSPSWSIVFAFSLAAGVQLLNYVPPSLHPSQNHNPFLLAPHVSCMKQQLWVLSNMGCRLALIVILLCCVCPGKEGNNFPSWSWMSGWRPHPRPTAIALSCQVRKLKGSSIYLIVKWFLTVVLSSVSLFWFGTSQGENVINGGVKSFGEGEVACLKSTSHWDWQRESNFGTDTLVMSLLPLEWILIIYLFAIRNRRETNLSRLSGSVRSTISSRGGINLLSSLMVHLNFPDSDKFEGQHMLEMTIRTHQSLDRMWRMGWRLYYFEQFC